MVFHLVHLVFMKLGVDNNDIKKMSNFNEIQYNNFIIDN